MSTGHFAAVAGDTLVCSPSADVHQQPLPAICKSAPRQTTLAATICHAHPQQGNNMQNNIGTI
eukprot:717383-Rhodomonas_salina.1